jgi:hypothetical protein
MSLSARRTGRDRQTGRQHGGNMHTAGQSQLRKQISSVGDDWPIRFES